uniref:Uncharacterized protein n=1 Tax=Pipistrellus kuhlii TaxID=59472 RepID=A0A7J8A8F2_PIPKU|nr:hypothetical protein mPipKuh1_008826 [Pipistrellus kuhlii]
MFLLQEIKILATNKVSILLRYQISSTMPTTEEKSFLFNSYPRIIFHCFLERQGKTERNINVRETHHLVASCTHPDQGLGWGGACNQAMCPSPELSLGPFSPQAYSLSTEPNQLGLEKSLFLFEQNVKTQCSG